MTLRLAGSNSLQSSALTSPSAVEAFGRALGKAGEIIYPMAKKGIQKHIL